MFSRLKVFRRVATRHEKPVPNLLSEMTMPKIRPLTTGDRAAWLHLWNAYQAFGTDGGEPSPPAVTEAVYSRLLDSQEPVMALVAEHHGKLLGFAHLVFHSSTTAAGIVCSLLDLFVDPSVHNQGIGRALLKEALENAKQRGADRIYWHVKKENEIAIRLYEKFAAPSGHIVYRAR